MPATRLSQVVEQALAKAAAETSAAGRAEELTGALSRREGRYLLTADVVYNGLGTPRAGAAVALFSEFDGEGVQSTSIVDVHDLRTAEQRHPASLRIDAGLAISPPVVNAHTHLDLSDMPFSPGSYETFIPAVVAHGRGGARGLEAARRGLSELRRAGTNIIGDIVTDEAVATELLASELRGVAYWEVIAPRDEDAETAFERAKQVIDRLRERERPGGMRVGVSPHTPHTVSAPLLKRLVGWARQQGLPIAIHVAESPSERDLQLYGNGPLAACLGAWNFPVKASGLSPVVYLDSLGVLAAAPTLVHMVAVDDDDVRLAQRHGCPVVHCPRSNDALACGRFPWELFARHGVDVAFGTDSHGSSPDLDVTQEVAFAAETHGERANLRGLVRAAVKGGHKALGLEPPVVRRGADADALVAWETRLARASRVL